MERLKLVNSVLFQNCSITHIHVVTQMLDTRPSASRKPNADHGFLRSVIIHFCFRIAFVTQMTSDKIADKVLRNIAALLVLKLHCSSRPFPVCYVVCDFMAILILQTAAGTIVVYSNSYCFLPRTSYLSMINRLLVMRSSFITQRVFSNILWDQSGIWVPCLVCLDFVQSVPIRA